MPAEIDRNTRLDDIAQATLDVASDAGVDAVTIRSVAARLGGSTTVITKFVPSRAALIDNVIRYVRRDWGDERNREVDSRTGIDRIRALIRWSVDTTDRDRVMRQFWIRALGDDNEQRRRGALREDARREHERIRAAVNETSREEWVADLIYLALRGYYLSTVEDPLRWPATRVASHLGLLIDATETPIRRTSTTKS